MNHYLPKKAEILYSEQHPFDKKLFRIKASLDFTPGQFVEISLPGIGEFPVSICSSPSEKEYFEICVKKVGRVTSYLMNFGEGDFIGFRGPLGNGFPMEKVRGEDVVVVAGGLGILPLRSFIKESIRRKWCNSLKILYGVREPDEMLFRNELEEWAGEAEVIEVFEKGGKRQGYVSDLIEEAELNGNEIAFVCGPPAMFVPVVTKLLNEGLKEERIFLSLERRMKCGIGKCGHCIVGGNKYTCIDGPVFSYAEYKKIKL